MWNRFPGVNLKDVAGNLKKQATEFATEVVKQAKTLADEEEFGSEGSRTDDESTPRVHDSSSPVGLLTQKPPTGGSQTSTSTYARPPQDHLTSTDPARGASGRTPQYKRTNDETLNPDVSSQWKPSVPGGDSGSQWKPSIPGDASGSGGSAEKKEGGGAQPSRLEALKARLEADKAKRQQSRRPSSAGQAQPASANASPKKTALEKPQQHSKEKNSYPPKDPVVISGSGGNQTLQQENEFFAGGNSRPYQGDNFSMDGGNRTNHHIDAYEHQQYNQEKSSSPPRTSSPPRVNKDFVERGPPFVMSPFKEKNPKSKDPQKYLHRMEELLRSDDFVDIPLNSPHNSVQLFPTANGHANPPATQTAAPAQGDNHDDSSHGNELQQLKLQFQKLRGELVNTVVSHEEEIETLQEDLEEKEKEILRLVRLEQQQSALHEEELSRLRTQFASELQEEWTHKIQILENELKAEREARQQQHAEAITREQAVQQEKQDLRSQVIELSSLRGDLDAERISHEQTSRKADVMAGELEQLRRTADAADQTPENADREQEGSHEELVRRCKDAEQHVQDLQEELEQRADDVRETIRDLAEENQAKDQVIQELQTQIPALQGQLDSLKGKLAESEAKTQELLSQLHDREKQLQDSQAHSQNLQTSLEEIRLQLQEAKRSKDGKAARLEVQLREVQTEAEERLQSENTRHQQQLEEKTQECRSLADELRSAQEEVKNAHDRLRQAEEASQSTSSHSQELEELKRERDRLKDEASQLQSQIRLNEQDMQLFETSYTEVTQREAALKVTLENRDQEQEQLLQRLAESHQQCEDLELQLHSATLRGPNTAQVEGAEEAKLTIQKLQRELDDQTAWAHSLQQTLEEQTSNSDMERVQALGELRSKCEDLEQRWLSSQATCSHLQAELERSHTVADSNGGTSDDSSEVLRLRAALQDAETGRETAKQQLSRLKQQMVSDQDDEEEKIRWRVDAEVQSALRLAASEQEAADSSASLLREKLKDAEAQIQGLQTDLSAWEAAVAKRDVELQNLQGALGELTYESEAAERTKVELRAAKLKVQDLRLHVLNEKAAQDELRRQKEDMEHQVARNQEDLAVSQKREERLLQDMQNLHATLQDHARKIQMLTSDSSSMIDRRIAVKLLTTYLSRGQTTDDLDLMARMLGFTDGEKVEIQSSRKGVLRSVAAVPRSLVAGLAGSTSGPNNASQQQDKDSFTSSWVDFLSEPEKGEPSDTPKTPQNGPASSSQQS